MRLLVPPPQRTAYFSRARSPGVVLRVSRTIAPVPSRASAQRRVCVAMPESRLSRFSRVRSPTSMARVEPRRTARTSPRRTRSPSSWRGSTSTSADPSRSVTARNTTVASGSPATTPSSRATTCAVLRWAAGMVAAVVTSRPGKPPRSSSRAIPTTRGGRRLGKEVQGELGHRGPSWAVEPWVGREEVLGGGPDRRVRRLDRATGGAARPDVATEAGVVAVGEVGADVPATGLLALQRRRR